LLVKNIPVGVNGLTFAAGWTSDEDFLSAIVVLKMKEFNN
jgi:hypothetical protein